MCGDIVRPRALWTDKDGEKHVGLGGLHKLLAQDPTLRWALVCGVKDWERNHMCSELWGPSRPYL